MVLFPIAVIWLVVIFVWVLRNSRNAPPEERVWRRWRPSPRKPRDGGETSRSRARARRESTRTLTRPNRSGGAGGSGGRPFVTKGAAHR